MYSECHFFYRLDRFQYSNKYNPLNPINTVIEFSPNFKRVHTHNTVHSQIKFCFTPLGSPNLGQHLLDRSHLPAKLPTTGEFQQLDQDTSLSIVPSGDHSQHYASPQSIPSSGHYLLDKASPPFHLGPTKVSISY